MIACGHCLRIVVVEGVGDKWPVGRATAEKGVVERIEEAESQARRLVGDRIGHAFHIS